MHGFALLLFLNSRTLSFLILRGLLQYLVLIEDETVDEEADEISDLFTMEQTQASSDSEDRYAPHVLQHERFSLLSEGRQQPRLRQQQQQQREEKKEEEERKEQERQEEEEQQEQREAWQEKVETVKEKEERRSEGRKFRGREDERAAKENCC